MKGMFRDISNESGWVHFLAHLADEENWSAREVISVVEKSWKWEKEFDEFIAAAGATDPPDFRTLEAMLNGWHTPAELAEMEAEDG
jgi:hypothetical protein